MERQQWDWSFYGFETSLGNRPVRDWIVGLPLDALDELVDVLVYMQKRPNSEWSPENFKPLEDGLSEIRFSDESQTYRIYGYFGPHRQAYTFLVGKDKKVSNDKSGKNLAKTRRGQLQRNEARIHLFSFEE